MLNSVKSEWYIRLSNDLIWFVIKIIWWFGLVKLMSLDEDKTTIEAQYFGEKHLHTNLSPKECYLYTTLADRPKLWLSKYKEEFYVAHQASVVFFDFKLTNLKFHSFISSLTCTGGWIIHKTSDTKLWFV